MVKIGSQYAWWFLSRKQKKALRLKRAGGEFGGESAKGVGKAPYFWAQEYGEPKAAIAAKRYVKDAFNRWRSKAGSIMSAHLAGR